MRLWWLRRMTFFLFERREARERAALFLCRSAAKVVTPRAGNKKRCSPPSQHRRRDAWSHLRPPLKPVLSRAMLFVGVVVGVTRVVINDNNNNNEDSSRR